DKEETGEPCPFPSTCPHAEPRASRLSFICGAMRSHRLWRRSSRRRRITAAERMRCRPSLTGSTATMPKSSGISTSPRNRRSAMPATCYASCPRSRRRPGRGRRPGSARRWPRGARPISSAATPSCSMAGSSRAARRGSAHWQRWRGLDGGSGFGCADGMTETRNAEPRNAAPRWLKPATDYGPLAVFLIAYALQGLMAATAALLAATLVALALSLYYERRVPAMPLLTASVVLVFGGLTLWLQDETFIKMKPTIINALFAVLLLGGLAFRQLWLRPLLGAALSLTEE